MKESFVLYNSFYAPIQHLDDETMGKLFRAIYEYQISGIECEDILIKMPFEFFKNQFRLDNEKYEKRCEANRRNAKRGGRPRKDLSESIPIEPNVSESIPNKPKETEKTEWDISKPKKPDNDNDKDNDKDITIVINEDSKNEFLKTAQYLATMINSFNHALKLNPENFVRDISDIVRLDGFTHERIRDCITWVFKNKKDTFYKGVILNGKKLRNNLPAIENKMILEKEESQKQQQKNETLIERANREAEEMLRA